MKCSGQKSKQNNNSKPQDSRCGITVCEMFKQIADEIKERERNERLPKMTKQFEKEPNRT